MFLSASAYFLGGHVSLMGRYRPAVTERIDDHAITIAPEHIRDWHSVPGTRPDRARDEAIDVIHIEVDGDRRALERLGRKRATPRHFIDEHHPCATDLDRGVHEFSVLARQPHSLHRAEGAFYRTRLP